MIGKPGAMENDVSDRVPKDAAGTREIGFRLGKGSAARGE